MTIILETEDLRNTTPATISRCGLVFMESEKYVKPKQILNAWLRYLPSTLQEYLKEIEDYCNYLIKEALDIVESNRERQNIIYLESDNTWIVKSFIKIMDALIIDFREMEKKGDSKTDLDAQKTSRAK